MQFLSKALLLTTLGALTISPLAANHRGWFIGTERDASVITQANACPAEYITPNGKCLPPLRGATRRRSIFGGSYGHGK